MAFSVPNFNLTVNIFSGSSGGGGTPREVTVGNLSMGRRLVATHENPVGGPLDVHTYVFLLLPAFTDVRDAYGISGEADIVEVPADSGRKYGVFYVDDVAKGFPNEYRECVLIKSPGWPEPIP